MNHSGIIGRLRSGWRALFVGAILGALLFGAYATLTRSAGSYSQTLTFQLSDPRVLMAELNLGEQRGAEETATGVAALLQATAVESYDLGNVRVGVRGIEGSHTVVVTLTGASDAVMTSSAVLQEAFPKDRAVGIKTAANHVLESTRDLRDSLTEEVARLDEEVTKLAPSDGVLRERLLLDRLETTRAVLSAEREIRDLERLRDRDPFVNTRLVVASEGRSVGVTMVAAIWLGLVFGTLAGAVVLLTKQEPPALSGSKRPVEDD